jgi:hypothetical protein
MTKPVALDRKGLRLTVYRRADGADCTNGGITSTVKTVTVVGYQKRIEAYPGVRPPVLHVPADMRVFAPDDDAPAVVLVESPNRVNDGRYGPYLTPLEYAMGGVRNGVGPMAGGNHAGTSDSRWGDFLWKYFGCNGDAVRVHDRVETAEQYRALSGD